MDRRINTIRLSDDFIAKVDGWAGQQADNPGRSADLVEAGVE
jgi:hypothetical protein